MKRNARMHTRNMKLKEGKMKGGREGRRREEGEEERRGWIRRLKMKYHQEEEYTDRKTMREEINRKRRSLDHWRYEYEKEGKGMERRGEGKEEGVRGAVLIYFSMSEHSKELIELHLCKLSPSLSLSF